jgi:hypothetical protein
VVTFDRNQRSRWIGILTKSIKVTQVVLIGIGNKKVIDVRAPTAAASASCAEAPSLIRIFARRATEKQYRKMRVARIPSYGKIRDRILSGTLLDMNDQTSNPRLPVARESEIEFLARETGTPVDTVREIYRVEHDKLERSARIKTFVSVLAHRRVKALLHAERGKSHGTRRPVGQANNF